MLYLDHAATSFPKPQPVLDAIVHWYTELGVSSSRGSSHRCVETAQIVQRARAGIGRMCGVPAARVAFTSGATESINLFLRALLRTGDRVLTTAFEHSSVVRPLVQLERDRGIALSVLPADGGGGLDPAAVRTALQQRPRLLVFTHASNVTGAVLDAAAFCAEARARGTTTLLDVSQTAGHLPIDVGADAIAGSAHKALLGPPGLGFLAVRADLELAPQKQGGTGSSTALAEHPTEWPQAFEAGTPNTPAICGLDAALRWHAAHGAGVLLQRAVDAVAELASALAADPRCRLLPPPPGPRTPVLSFVRSDLDPAEVGAILDQHDIHVRTGHHCAPWIHPYLGTALAGTVRISPGADITASDIRQVSAVLAS
jgi:cysteine desulfurase / selenocysteine lyase